MKLNKSKFNLTIDIIMFIVMMAIAGIGFMIKYVLIAGFKRNDIYGINNKLYYWGMDRHEWGNIHLILSFILLFLLLLHIIFHWNLIVCIFKRMVPDKTWRIALSALFVLLSVILGIMPLFVTPEIHENDFNYRQHKQRSHQVPIKDEYLKENQVSPQQLSCSPNTPSKQTNEASHEKHNLKNIEIFGFMTLNEVASKYDIPVSELASSINIPVDRNNERLGRLRKQYNFQLSELKTYIESKK